MREICKMTAATSGKLNSMLTLSRGFCLVFTLLVLGTACKKEPDAPTIFPLEIGALSASVNTVVISSSTPGSEAVKLSWTGDANDRIDYDIVLKAASGTDSVRVTSNERTFTMAELNNILVNNLKMQVGVASDVTVYVNAFVPVNGKSAKSNELNIKVTPDVAVPAYSSLWIVGDATPAGWDIDKPTPMVQTADNLYEFTYTGELKAGLFKVPTATGNWNCDYFMPPTNGEGITATKVTVIKGGQPDNQWKITEAGNYKITINQLFETIKFEKL
jgi:hypothetical protein